MPVASCRWRLRVRVSSLADETPKGKQTLMAVRPTLSPHRSPPTIATPVAIVAPASAVERLELTRVGRSVCCHPRRLARHARPDRCRSGCGRPHDIRSRAGARAVGSEPPRGSPPHAARRRPHPRALARSAPSSPSASTPSSSRRTSTAVSHSRSGGVCAGQISFPQSLRGTLARPALSAREKQVLGMVVLGLANREIAHKLRLSESTVKSHLATSYTQLSPHSRRGGRVHPRSPGRARDGHPRDHRRVVPLGG